MSTHVLARVYACIMSVIMSCVWRLFLCLQHVKLRGKDEFMSAWSRDIEWDACSQTKRHMNATLYRQIIHLHACMRKMIFSSKMFRGWRNLWLVGFWKGSFRLEFWRVCMHTRTYLARKTSSYKMWVRKAVARNVELCSKSVCVYIAKYVCC